MTAENDPVPFRRILVALDSTAESLAALETAAWLAGALRSKLTGLFVEEQDLLHLADLPFSKEVPLTRATARTLDPTRLRREMRARATLARQAVEKVAQQRKIDWSFEILRGHSEIEVTATSARSDMIAVARETEKPGRITRVTAAQPRRTLLVTRRQVSPAAGPITALLDASAGAGKALRLAADLAQANGVPLRVLAWADTEATLEKLHSAARDSIAGPIPIAFQGTIGTLVDSLPQRLCQVERGLIILADNSGLFSPDDIERLLESARCPLLILRDAPPD